MNVLSLFSGVGGIDLGLERAGMRVVGQCESDKAARRILARHWPGVPCSEDVTRLDAGWLTSHGLHAEPAGRSAGSRSAGRTSGGTGDEAADLPIHIVCGGFPCQDLSVAGKRAGLAGERSGLFHEAARIADLVLGDGGWLLIENVPGLLSSNGGADFGVVLSTLADLGFHDLAWRTLDSRFFGVPQRRRRVFILARRARGDRARAVLLEPESGGGDFAPGREARKSIAEHAGTSLEATGATQGLTTRFGNSGPDLPDAEAGWLVAQSGPEVAAHTHTLTAEGYDASEDGTGRGTPLTVAAGTAKCLITSQERQDYDTQDFVTVGAFMAGQGAKAGGIGYEQGISPTLKAASGSNRAPTIHGAGVRRLTPVECERLQGFPDGWTITDDTPWQEHPKPDGPRYAQMGNAVTVPVAEWIGRRIMEHGA